MADGTIITSVTDALAVCSSIIESANNEIVYLTPPSLLVLASQFGLTEKTKMLIQKGGRVQGIADLSNPYIKEVRERVAAGARCAPHLSVSRNIYAGGGQTGEHQFDEHRRREPFD